MVRTFNKAKICLIGEAGVGKTSLVSLLKGREIVTERKPTVGLEIENSQIDEIKCSIWDLAGQERFKIMWKDFIRGSGLTILVCDSTEKNIEKSKQIIHRMSNHLGAKVIAIANKQDLDGALSAESIEKKLGIRTYGMSALRPELRSRMKKILEYELTSEE
jgi:small GTP-binding protein